MNCSSLRISLYLISVSHNPLDVQLNLYLCSASMFSPVGTVASGTTLPTVPTATQPIVLPLPRELLQLESSSAIPQAVIDHHVSPSIEDSIRLIHELLGILETEATCANFFQERGMGLRRIARSIRYLEKVPNCTLVGLSCDPFTYRGENHDYIIPKDGDGYICLKRQTSLRITTHLDEESNLHAAVADAVPAVMGRPQMLGIVYGIGFSFFCHYFMMHNYPPLLASLRY